MSWTVLSVHVCSQGMEGWRYYVAALLLLLPTLLATALLKRCGASPCREGNEVGALNKYGKGSCVKHASGERVRYRPENLLEKMIIKFMAVRLAQVGETFPAAWRCCRCRYICVRSFLYL